MRVSPIIRQISRSNSTPMGSAFSKLGYRQQNEMAKDDIYFKLAEASMQDNKRGKRIESELRIMGLIN